MALGAGLQGTGRHQVRFVAPDDFSALAASAGLDFHSLGLSIRDLLSTPAMRAFLEPGGNLIVGLRQLLQLLRPLFDRMMERTWSAAQGADITGYWYLDPPADWQPPADLLDFLSAGAPPVYVGFGSLPERSAARITQIVVGALRRAGQRGVLATGWGGLSRAAVPPSVDVFFLEAVPHAWLFPRLAAIVHHGGSGTTGAALRAGVPMIMVPHAGDQPLWARCVVELGVSPAPIPRRRLTADRLAEAMSRAVADQDLRARAALVGERIRAGDGIAQAIAVIERAAA